MPGRDGRTAADRLQQTLELVDFATQMLRQRMRREHPDWSEAEIEDRVIAWYHDRPGAEHGDAEGESGTWPRR